MTFDVLVFGPVATAVNADRVSVTIAPGGGAPAITAADVLAAIAVQHPALAFAMPAAQLAVNLKRAGPDAPVRPGDELALLALLGGG